MSTAAAVREKPGSAGWREFRPDPRTRLRVVPEFAAAVERHIADPEWVEALFRPPTGTKSPAAGGRALLRPLAIERADGGIAPVLVRTGQRGGLLAPWLGDRHVGPGRAWRELDVSLALEAQAAPIASPVLAAARQSYNLPLWRTAFATRRVDEARDLREIVSQGVAEGVAARRVGDAIRAYHDCGASHADLNLGNVLYVENEARAVVVDLDRARLHGRGVPMERRMRELMRLRRSLRKLAGSELAREARWIAPLVAGYCRGDRTFRKRLLSHADREWRRLGRHEALRAR